MVRHTTIKFYFNNKIFTNKKLKTMIFNYLGKSMFMHCMIELMVSSV